MISIGKVSQPYLDIQDLVSEGEILAYYFHISKVPSVICSPLRKDRKPSFGIYSPDGYKICYRDFSTGDSGSIFDLLSKMWNCTFKETLHRINEDIPSFRNTIINKPCYISKRNYDNSSDLQCKVREWKDYDIEYWKSYGISLKWLKYAEVYPISHKIVLKDGQRYVFGCDKLAYAYVERKEGKVTLKIYQPYNKMGFKWSNKHDSSVISLWTKIPKEGDKVCICSSLKDALCLSCNTNIPALAVQGEGYSMSDTAIAELKKRYKKVFILFDNDEAGLIDGEKLSKKTGFTNLILPTFEGGKDISDAYKVLGKEQFLKIILNLFKDE